jgi:predicted nucleotidyltransferase
VAKTFGIADVVQKALEPFKRKITLAFIYGSVARGEHDASSDVDVLAVGDIAPSRLAPAQIELRQVLGRRVSFVVYDEVEFRKLSTDGDHFIANVLSQPKIWLVGSDSALENSDGLPARKSRRAKAA